jgi:hypothetical protein
VFGSPNKPEILIFLFQFYFILDLYVDVKNKF